MPCSGLPRTTTRRSSTKKGPLFYHKWRIVAEHNGESTVGEIVGYRDDRCEEPRPYTSTTPFILLWKYRYLGEEDNFEEFNKEELGELLSRAHRDGCNGPMNGQRPSQQLHTHFPNWERRPVKKRRGSEKERVAKARETKAEK